MASKSKKVPPDDNLATYQGAVMTHFIEQLGEDPKNPGRPNRIRDSKYTVTVGDEELLVHIHGGSITSIDRIPPKVFPTLAGCKH
jgi:hypothetical protein